MPRKISWPKQKAVSTKSRNVVWARAAGRCHFPGCNRSMIGDLIAGNEDANFGFIAHIVSDKPTGPRHDKTRGPQLRDDPSNLMLLCYPHHKLVDVDEVQNYPEQRLLEIKAAHEKRVSIVSDIAEDRASHVLRYGAKIGNHESPLTFAYVRTAIIPDRYPANGDSIGIEILGSSNTDSENTFWSVEPENLRKQFATKVRERIERREISHLSVFALAPIPLLMLLGSELGDITPINVFQLHREPKGWSWAESGERVNYVLESSDKKSNLVALKLELSASISDERIKSVLGDDVAIWSLRAERPGNDMMRYSEDLVEFRRQARKAFHDIKAQHGESAVIHVFPAVPVSVAVEFGRVRMPKADLRLEIYDQIKDQGFVHRLQIF